MIRVSKLIGQHLLIGSWTAARESFFLMNIFLLSVGQCPVLFYSCIQFRRCSIYSHVFCSDQIMKPFISLRFGFLKMAAFNMAAMDIDNDGKTDGHCSLKGSFGSYINDIMLDPLYRWGIK